MKMKLLRFGFEWYFRERDQNKEMKVKFYVYFVMCQKCDSDAKGSHLI